VAILMGEVLQEPNRGFSRLVTETCLQPWLRPSRPGDPEVPTMRRVGPEEESEPRSNRLALYRTSYLEFGERPF
jgi:hypothetical protein